MKIKILLSALLIILLFTSCENEDVDDVAQITSVDLIAEESQLFNLLTRVSSDEGDSQELTCINFIYSFMVGTYDENLNLLNTAVVANDGDLYQYLQNVGESEFINISFPITSVDEEGNTFEVTSKEELATAIADCKGIIEEQIIGECTELLLECVWEVSTPETVVFNTYERAVFDNASNGNSVFYYRGDSYQGTWIVYFINDELHVNISLADGSEVGQHWNFDWKVVIVTSEEMQFTNDLGDIFVLQKICQPEIYCTTLTFQECENNAEEGTSSINPLDYSECVVVIAAPQPFFNEETGEISNDVAWIVSYHISQADAEFNLNPITSEIEVSNDGIGQLLFARIENPVSGIFYIEEVVFQSISCD